MSFLQPCFLRALRGNLIPQCALRPKAPRELGGFPLQAGLGSKRNTEPKEVLIH